MLPPEYIALGQQGHDAPTTHSRGLDLGFKTFLPSPELVSNTVFKSKSPNPAWDNLAHLQRANSAGSPVCTGLGEPGSLRDSQQD